jgi:NAD(P)H-hydrate epimerase
MVHPWTADFELPENCSAVLIGPGLAAPDLPGELRHLTQRLWRELTIPLIVDASALDWLPSDPSPKGSLRVMTPHPGEAARLLQTTAAEVQAARPKALRRLSDRMGGCLVVLKGHETLVGRATGRISVNGSGNPHLAQGGAGDLLGGYLAGLLAQPALREDDFRTIRFAVWQHGASADRLQSSRPNWTVEDLAEVLGSLAS